jgi:mannitol operon repressor
MTGGQTLAEPELMVRLATELGEESDRAMAVLAAAYMDHLLGNLIISVMTVEDKEVEDLLFDGPNAPLGSFSSRINMAYCLGLLSRNQRKDLDIIRKVRNQFAHEFIGVSFDTEGIANRCRELESAKIGGQPATARECFKKASVRLMVDILLKITAA